MLQIPALQIQSLRYTHLSDMNRWQYLTVSALGALSLILSISLIISGESNRSLQAGLQAQQSEINKGSMSQQVATNLLRDIAGAATKDDKLKELLTRNGFTLTENPTASPSPSP